MQLSRVVFRLGRLLLALSLLACLGAPALAQTAGHLMNSYGTGSFFTSSSPAIGVDGSIIVGCGNGYIYGFDPNLTGIDWSYNADGEIISSPAVGPTGNVYFTANIALHDKRVFGVSSSGGYLWEFSPPSAGTMVSSPAVAADGTVYVNGANNVLYALDGQSGDKVWEYPVQLNSCSPAVGAMGRVYVGSNHKFSALNQHTGAAVWENTADLVSDYFVSGAAIGKDGTIYVGSNGSRLYAFDWRTGKVKWTFDEAVHTIYSSPVIGPDGTVYFGSDDYKLYAVDGKTGEKKWAFATGNMIRSSPAVGDDGTVYIGSLDYKMYAIDGETGTKDWEYTTGNAIYSSPILSDDGILYFTSQDGYIYGLYTSSNGLADSPWPVGGCTIEGARRYDGPYAVSYPSTWMPLLTN